MFSAFNVFLMISNAILFVCICVMSRGYSALRDEVRDLREELRERRTSLYET